VSDQRPPEDDLPRVKGRLPFAPPGAGRPSLKQSSLLVYGLITAGLIGVALYMALIERMDWLSPWVAGPAVGAMWFALRLFMIWGSRG
jgi:hypothetical protein